MDVCRNEIGYHPVDVFLNLTCALCYFYTFHSADPILYPLKINDDGLLVREFWNGSAEEQEYFRPTAGDSSSPVYDYAFPKWDLGRHAELWNECCEAAADCCNMQLKEKNREHDCPPTWDGWQCWNGAKKGEVISGGCPAYVHPFSAHSCSGVSEKTCDLNGDWQRHQDENGTLYKEWTNYTSCINLSPFHYRFQVQIVAYCVSIIFLVPALILFWKWPQLHVQRNFIHMNFFASLLMYAFMLIIFQTVITQNLLENPDYFAISNTQVECRIIHILTSYLRLCNYCWMFCEGFFLLRHLKHVFAREQRFIVYIIVGWGFPAVFVAIYAGLRSTESSGCWIESKNSLEWILKVPALITLSLNFIFLCYIICLFVRNLQTQYVSEIDKFKKSCRAVLVLMPLFGLHFLITGYRPLETCYNQWYFYVNSCLDGLQGFFVAVTFCYCNSEVIVAVKKSIFQWRMRADCSLQRSLSTQSTSSGRYSVNSRSSTSISTWATWVEQLHKPANSGKKKQIRLCRFESLVGRPERPEDKVLIRSASNTSGLVIKPFETSGV